MRRRCSEIHVSAIGSRKNDPGIFKVQLVKGVSGNILSRITGLSRILRPKSFGF